MVSHWTVLYSLRQSITLDERGAENALPLCRACLNRLLCRLRDESYADDERLAEAAAGMALYRLVRRRILDDDAMTVYKAGDVSVSRTPQAMLEYARRVRDESLAAASELLLDDGFVFKQVGDGE